MYRTSSESHTILVSSPLLINMVNVSLNNSILHDCQVIHLSYYTRVTPHDKDFILLSEGCDQNAHCHHVFRSQITGQIIASSLTLIRAFSDV